MMKKTLASLLFALLAATSLADDLLESVLHKEKPVADSQPAAVPQSNAERKAIPPPVAPETTREERLRRRLEDAERRAADAEAALQDRTGSSPPSTKVQPNLEIRAVQSPDSGDAWVKCLWGHLKDMEYGFGLLGGYYDVGGMGCGGITLKMEVDPVSMLGLEMRLGVWGQGSGTPKVRYEWNDKWNHGNGVRTLKGVDIYMMEVGLLGKLPLGKVTLFGGGGGGGYALNGDRKDDGYVVYHDSSPYYESGPYSHSKSLGTKSTFGAYVFGGLEVALSTKISLLGEVRYNWLQLDLDTHIFNLDGLGADIGVTFWLR